MTCPEGPYMPFRECSKHLLTSFGLGRETSDNRQLLWEPLSTVILGHTDSCHTCQTMKKSANTWLWFRQMLKEHAGQRHPISLPFMCRLVDVQSSLDDAMTYQQRAQGRLNNNLVDSFLSYLIHSDKERAWIGLCWQPWVNTKIMSSHKHVNCTGRKKTFQHLSKCES